MVLIFFALAFLIINNPENNRQGATFFFWGGGRLQISYIFVLRVGKILFTKRLLKLLRVIRINKKFANFAGLDFPIKFCDQTLKFY